MAEKELTILRKSQFRISNTSNRKKINGKQFIEPQYPEASLFDFFSRAPTILELYHFCPLLCPSLKCAFNIYNFPEEISSHSPSVTFLYVHAPFIEEGLLVCPCYFWNYFSVLSWMYLSLSPCFSLLFFLQLFVKPPQISWDKEEKKRIHRRTVQINLNELDSYDGVVSNPESDFPEHEVKWALGSTATNKASGCDGIPAELFKDDAIKVLHSICQQIGKTQQ